jgi:hypothetical protein
LAYLLVVSTPATPSDEFAVRGITTDVTQEDGGDPGLSGWKRHSDPGWTGRDGAGLLVLQDELYLLGGWLYGPMSSEVWRTHDLSVWEYLGDAPWPGRHGAGWVVHDERLWVIGGDLHSDVWSSPDGTHWTLETGDAPFGPRYTPNAVSLDGALVVFAGQSWIDDCWCTPIADSTVWRSANGRTWSKIADAPWQGRGLIHGSVVHDGEVYLIGGGIKAARDGHAETITEFVDIWTSSDGISWRRRGDVPFLARTHFSVLAAPDGCYVSDGSVGRQSNLTNSLYFAEDCLSFHPIETPASFGIRHASSVAWFEGGLVILGGPDERAGTDVWRFVPPNS